MNNKSTKIIDVPLRNPCEKSASASVRGNDQRVNHLAITGRLVRPPELLEQLFAPECRPSLGWLRAQIKAKSIPHVRIGHLLFFDLEMVRGALCSACLSAPETTLNEPNSTSKNERAGEALLDSGGVGAV